MTNKSEYILNCVERIVMASAGTPKQRDFCNDIVLALSEKNILERHALLVVICQNAEAYAESLKNVRELAIDSTKSYRVNK